MEEPVFWYGWFSEIGAAGWLMMALLWGGLLAAIIWAVTRLFPRGRD